MPIIRTQTKQLQVMSSKGLFQLVILAFFLSLESFDDEDKMKFFDEFLVAAYAVGCMIDFIMVCE